MVEKIPQHRHCRQCGKAFIGTGQHCSPECEQENKVILKKRKRQLVILYVLTMFILAVAVIAMNL